MGIVDTHDGSRKLVMGFVRLGYTSIAATATLMLFRFGSRSTVTTFIVDCGTYAYHSNPAWRTFFCVTAAHNTGGSLHGTTTIQTNTYIQE